jgi:hypothetical protein
MLQAGHPPKRKKSTTAGPWPPAGTAVMKPLRSISLNRAIDGPGRGGWRVIRRDQQTALAGLAASCSAAMALALGLKRGEAGGQRWRF